jgi:hypothetical protein
VATQDDRGWAELAGVSSAAGFQLEEQAMRLAFYGLILAAIPILIGHGISHAANEQGTPAPGISPQAIAHYRSMLSGYSPESANALMTEAAALLHIYSGVTPGSAGWQELQSHKAELENMRSQLCQALLKC